MNAQYDLERTEARIRWLSDEIVGMLRAMRLRSEAMCRMAKQYREKWNRKDGRVIRTLDGRDPFEDAIPGMKPGDSVLRASEDHLFKITATNEVGCDSGRRRYRVECQTCRVLVHEATTGPQHMMRYHVRDAEDGCL